jgi:hypothetical protein
LFFVNFHKLGVTDELDMTLLSDLHESIVTTMTSDDLSKVIIESVIMSLDQERLDQEFDAILDQEMSIYELARAFEALDLNK